jgi:hypothetical protein
MPAVSCLLPYTQQQCSLQCSLVSFILPGVEPDDPRPAMARGAAVGQLLGDWSHQAGLAAARRAERADGNGSVRSEHDLGQNVGVVREVEPVLFRIQDRLIGPQATHLADWYKPLIMVSLGFKSGKESAQ